MSMIQLLLVTPVPLLGSVNTTQRVQRSGSTDQPCSAHHSAACPPNASNEAGRLHSSASALPPRTPEPELEEEPAQVRCQPHQELLRAASPKEALDKFPKLRQQRLFLARSCGMLKGQFKGFFAWGMNPAVSGANSNKTREAMTKLDWMVNVNIYDNETGGFWLGVEHGRRRSRPKSSCFPCSVSVEKEGSVSNSTAAGCSGATRGPKPLGDSRPDGEIIYEAMAHKVCELYKKEGGKFPRARARHELETWATDMSSTPTRPPSSSTATTPAMWK